MAHVEQTKPGGVQGDIAAAIAYLRSPPRRCASIFTVGFCFGGAHSFAPAAPTVSPGVIGFYG